MKTHADVLVDFTMGFAAELARMGQEMGFVIFEDRKFADIGALRVVRSSRRHSLRDRQQHRSRAGSTVVNQYSAGLHRIVEWSDLVNAHSIPGPGIISGLSQVGLPHGRALLLLAEMSSKGNLATGGYTTSVVEMAEAAGREFVVGFIAMDRRSLSSPPSDWLIMTPGVDLALPGDILGQQYRTPEKVVHECGCDVIIVGRGIIGQKGEEGMRAAAEKYRDAGWAAYEARLANA